MSEVGLDGYGTTPWSETIELLRPSEKEKGRHFTKEELEEHQRKNRASTDLKYCINALSKTRKTSK